MAKYQFQYRVFPNLPSPAFPRGRVSVRPALVISLRNGPKRLSCLAIVDSGADACVFPRSFMAPLGIDPLKTPTESCSGIGGIAVAHYSAVAVEIPGILPFLLYAGFTDGLENAGVGLLGHAGFFSRFKVTFDVRNGVFELEDSPSEESGR